MNYHSKNPIKKTQHLRLINKITLLTSKYILAIFFSILGETNKFYQMKKVLMLVAAVGLFSTASYGQKFESGDKNVEVQFAPLGGAPISISGIRLRSFTSETSALRLNVNLSLANEKSPNGTTTDGSVIYDKESTFNINIRPGIEKHLAGTDRLSPYFGGELDIAFQSHSEKNEYENPGEVDKVETLTTTGQNGFLRFGVNAVAGFDWYFADKLYMGAEIGFGIGFKSMSDVKVDNTIDGFTAPDPQEQGSTFNIGPNFNSAIRLGYCF